MKNFLLILFFILTHNGYLLSQINRINYKTITQEQYQKHFPTDMSDALLFPTNDIVYILPTNEVDTIKQNELNKFYNEVLIRFYNSLPSQKSRIITDKQALSEDLSDVNIFAFGTRKGNLWTSRFLDNSQDFPIKIYNDSIVTDTVYRGNNYLVTAAWYNPLNVKHSVIIYTPQSIDFAKNTRFYKSSQYRIFKNNTEIPCSYYYHLINGKWIFVKGRDKSLVKDKQDFINNNHFTRINDLFYRYPSINDLDSCLISDAVLPVDKISIKNINNSIDEITDMEWLRPIAKSYKIIAIGESHHLKYNNYILNKIIIAANTYDYYPILVLEMPYSWGAYMDYYANIRDDKAAIIFRDSVLKKIGVPYNEKIRIWNKFNSDKTIKIVCSDIEHYYKNTINFILNPYLKKINPKLEFRLDDTLKSYIEDAQRLILQAKKINLIGEFPFQTPTCMENVFENLKSSIPIKTNQKKWHDHTDRFKVMIRNVTDSSFLGKYISTGKSIFFGGSEHFRLKPDSFLILTNKEQPQTEGFYLANYFEPTKGKTYSIKITTLGISIEDSVRKIDPGLRFDIETDLINLYKQNLIKLHEPIISNIYVSESDEYFYKLSHQFPNYVFRTRGINFKEFYKLHYNGIKRFRILTDLNTLQDFNTNIIIPFSPIGDQ